MQGAAIRAALEQVGAVGRQIRGFDELATSANAALLMAPAGLTVDGAASWMATQTQESAYLRTTREYADSSAWYWPYIGRTFEQLTHEEAYRRFGAWCFARGLVGDPSVFAKNPAALEDHRWAWLGGIFYFEWRNLWPLANRGDHFAVSQSVNLGPRAVGTKNLPKGWAEREAMFWAFRAVGSALLPTRASGADSGRRRRQQQVLLL